MRSPCCLFVSGSPLPLTFEHLNLSLWNLDCMSWHLSPLSSEYLTNRSHWSSCRCAYSLLDKGSVKCIPHFNAKKRLGKHVPAATNTRNNRRTVGRVCGSVDSPPLSLLGNSSVNTFPWQRRIARSIVSYAVRLVSKESRRLVLRTCCS
jgi:hypothetical protein